VMDGALLNEDQPLPVYEKSSTLNVFVHSAVLPPPCLYVEGAAIYPDLVWSGNISTSRLCWTETDIEPLKASVAFATNLWCKTLKNGVCLEL